jgi:hypothetical protein
MRADIRFWTAVVMIGMCGFAVARGLRIVQFSVAMANVDTPEQRAEIAKTWHSVAEVAPTALRANLAYPIDPSDQKADNYRRQTLTTLVSIKPMSSYSWLSLSNLQLISDQPMEQVFDSLELSMLTGPNEGDVAAQRAVYAVSLWQRLPADLKNRAVLDVATMIFPQTQVEAEEIGKFRAVLATEPDWVRDELRQALVASGVRPQDIEQRLGF